MMHTSMNYLVFLAIITGLASTGHAQQEQAQAPGIEAFSRHDEFESIKISPDGKHLGVIITTNGRKTLAFFDLGTKKFIFSLKPGAHAMVYKFDWVNNERVVVELAGQKGTLDAPQRFGELYAVNFDGSKARMIAGYRAGEMQVGSNIKKSEGEQAWVELLDVLPDDPRWILVSSTPWSYSQDKHPSVYKLNVYSGIKRLVAISPVPFAYFVVDAKGDVRAAVGRDDHDNIKVFYRDDDKWIAMEKVKGFSKSTRPIVFLSDQQKLLVSHTGKKGVRGIHAVDLKTGESKKLFQHDIVDAHAGLWEDKTRSFLAAEYHPDYPAYEYINKEHPLSVLLKNLSAHFKNQHVKIMNLTDDHKQAVVFVYSDRNPGQYYLVNTEKLSVALLLSRRSWIDPKQMAESTPFKFEAGDGLTIYGYITLPPGYKSGKIPMVVLPHGGPHYERNYWGYDNEVQLLANQGFAVLEVNYRGSGGYGEEFEQVG